MIRQLAGNQKKALAKATAGGTADAYLSKHPGVAKHQEKVAARTERKAEAKSAIGTGITQKVGGALKAQGNKPTNPGANKVQQQTTARTSGIGNQAKPKSPARVGGKPL